MIPCGIVQGRFQILHKGHVEYFLAAKARCRFLLIGVTDHDPERSWFDPLPLKLAERNGPYRTLEEPFHTFTYFERLSMIRECLLDAGVSREEFDIVPFPVHRPHLLRYYVPEEATVFVTIYEPWGRQKLEIFRSLGFATEVLWEKDLTQRFTTGTEVRRRLAYGEDWESLVPARVAAFIKERRLDVTLQEMAVPATDNPPPG